jgi:mediator of RNA polymerase II transcription subunit 10
VTDVLCALLTLSQSRRNQVVDHLATLDHSSQNIQTMIPMQVLLDIDNAKNPMLLTKDRLERAATENQFMNGKIAAIEVSLPLRGC